MSLILDALRKSEAERRRGQAPSLYADMPAPSSALRPAWMPWLPVAGGILLLVGVAVYFTREGDAPVTKAELVEESDKSLVSTPPAADVDPTPAVAIAPPPLNSAPVDAPPLSPPPSDHAAAPAKNPASVDALVRSPANPVAAAADAAVNGAPAASVGVPQVPAPVSAPDATREAP